MCCAVVAVVAHHLRRNVGHGAALIKEHRVKRVNPGRHAEVPDFDRAEAIKQDVFQLDVSVHDQVLVEVLNASDDLSEDVFGLGLGQTAPLLQVGEQIPARTQLHHDAQFLSFLESLQQLYVVLMLQRFQNLDFLRYLLVLVLLTTVARLDRHQLASDSVQAQVHLPKAALSQDLAHPVHLNSCGRVRVLPKNLANSNSFGVEGLSYVNLHLS